MNIAEQLKDLCEVAKNNDIKINEVNDPEFKYKCAVVKKNEDFAIVFNEHFITDIAEKYQALKWALNCCIDESKTEWVTKNELISNNTNRP